MINLHRWPNGDVCDRADGQAYGRRLWIHASDQPARDLGRWRQTYARLHPGIEESWPKHFPTNALLGCVNATHILNGDKLAFAQPPSMNRETFSSVVIVCSTGAQRLLMPLRLFRTIFSENMSNLAPAKVCQEFRRAAASTDEMCSWVAHR